MPAGLEIKRLRTNAGKSAAEVAVLIGVDPERLRKWEQRDADPKDPDDVQKIEDYFGTKISKLNALDNFSFDSRRRMRSVEDDKEKELLYEIRELQKEKLREKENRTLDFQEALAELSIMNQAYLQVLVQYIVRNHPEFEDLSEEEKKAKVEEDLAEVRRGLHKALSKQRFS